MLNTLADYVSVVILPFIRPVSVLYTAADNSIPFLQSFPCFRDTPDCYGTMLSCKDESWEISRSLLRRDDWCTKAVLTAVFKPSGIEESASKQRSVAMDGIAVVVEGGVHVQHPQTRLFATSIARKSGSQFEQGEAATVFGKSVLDFFWTIVTRVTGYVSKLRRFFVFTPTKEGSLQFKEGVLENSIKIEEGLAEASGAHEPKLTETIVSEKETGSMNGQDRSAELNHEDCGSKYCTFQIRVDEQSEICDDSCKLASSTAETQEANVTEHTTSSAEHYVNDPQRPSFVTCDSSKVVIQRCHGDCENNLQNTADEQSGTCDAYKLTLNVDNHERSSPAVEATGDQYLQGAYYVICSSVETLPLGMNDRRCTAEAPQDQKCQTQEQNASQEDLLDVVISNKCILLQAPSTPSFSCSDFELDKSVEDGSLEPPNLSTSSKSLNEMFSIQRLNAIVTEQLTKYLQVLERSMVSEEAEPPTWSHKTTHRRAIILATLVAVAVWVRNAKHLHEAMPRIKGSAIDVHIRSRL